MKRALAVVAILLGLGAAVAGVVISRSVVYEYEHPDGPMLRCGTAFVPDVDAASEYRDQQIARLFEEVSKDISSSSPFGSLSVATGKLRSVDLDAECNQALSVQRSWCISLWITGLACLIAGVVAWRWNSESGAKTRKAIGRVIEGARFPWWMRQCPDWIIASLTLAGGFTGLFTSIVEGFWRTLWFIVTGALLLTAAMLAIARDGERRRQERWIRDAEASHRQSLRSLLGDQLHNLLHVVAEAVSTAEVAERKTLAQSARMAIISAAANLVGQKAEHGTRANLFKWDPHLQVMKLAPMGFSGRGQRSERVFRPGDETYDATMKRKGTFEPSVGDDDETERSTLGYETYITYPVHVPNQIHGVLTVDCLHKGELVEDDDVAMMSVLACLIAITYECEKYPRPRT